MNNKKSLEEFVGKTLMPILATLLILFGLGSFIYLVYDKISDIVKFVLMFLFSFSLFGFSLFRMHKKNSVFNSSLNACGVGTVYVSILMTLFYFHYINEFALFYLIILWSGIVYYLSYYYENKLHNVISYIGFYYAIYLALTSYFISPILLFILASFVIIMNFIYTVKNKVIDTGNLSSNIILYVYFFCNTVGLYWFTYTAINIYTENLFEKAFAFTAALGLSVITLVNISQSSKLIGQDQNSPNKKLIHGLFFIANIFLNYLCASMLDIRIFRLTPIASFLIAMAATIIFFKIGSSTCKALAVISYWKCLSSLVLILNGNVILLSIFFLIFAIGNCFMLTFAKNNYSYIKYTPIIPLISFSLPLCHINPVLGTVVLSVLIFTMAIVIFFISYKCELNLMYIFFSNLIIFSMIAAPISLIFKSEILQYFLQTIILLLCIGIMSSRPSTPSNLHDFNSPFSTPSIFIYLSAITIVITEYTAFTFVVVSLFLFAFCMLYKNEFHDKNLFWTFNITNNIILLFLMMSIWSYAPNDYLSKSLFVIASIFQLIPMFNVPSNISNSAYINWFSLNITIYAVNAIYGFVRLYNMPYVHSMLFILIATIMIIFASKTNFKPIRLYGLILAIFSTLKLLLSDISYTNSIARVLSFMIAGILCFAIVFIYNKTSDNS